MISDAFAVRPLGNVTSANAVVYAECEYITSGPVLVRDFTADNAFVPDSREHIVTRRTLDGRMVYGVVNRAITFTLNVEPVSEFYSIVADCLTYVHQQYEAPAWNFDITIPSLRTRYNYTQGVILNAADMPAIGETMQPLAVQYEFTQVSFQSIGVDSY